MRAKRNHTIHAFQDTLQSPPPVTHCSSKSSNAGGREEEEEEEEKEDGEGEGADLEWNKSLSACFSS